MLFRRKKESHPHSHSTEREQDTQIRDSKESVLNKLYMHGYMNVDAEPMTFNEVRKLAKQLDIPDFDVIELNKYKRLAKKYKELANCIIWIPFGDENSLGHCVMFPRTRWHIELPGQLWQTERVPTGRQQLCIPCEQSEIPINLCQQLWLPDTPPPVHSRYCRFKECECTYKLLFHSGQKKHNSKMNPVFIWIDFYAYKIRMTTVNDTKMYLVFYLLRQYNEKHGMRDISNTSWIDMNSARSESNRCLYSWTWWKRDEKHDETSSSLCLITMSQKDVVGCDPILTWLCIHLLSHHR